MYAISVVMLAMLANLGLPIVGIHAQADNIGTASEVPFESPSSESECLTANSLFFASFALLMPIHSKDTITFQTYLEPSLRIFWPGAMLIALVDSDESYEFESELILRHVVKRVIRVGTRPRTMTPAKWQLLIQYKIGAAMATEFSYVGFVDTDAIFVTPVTEQIILDGGRPILRCRVGPLRNGNAAWASLPRAQYKLIGIPWYLDCMTTFPLVARTEHIAAFVIDMELDKLFTVSILNELMPHVALANFLWASRAHRRNYSWHLMEESSMSQWEERIVAGQASLTTLKAMRSFRTARIKPWPCPSIHAGHWVGLGKIHNAGDELGMERLRARVASMLHEGVCRALPFTTKGCLNETDMRVTIFEALFKPTSVEKLWLSSSPMQCLEAQQFHYAQLHRELRAHPRYTRVLQHRVVMNLLATMQRGALDLPYLYTNPVLLEHAADPDICPRAFCQQALHAAKAEAATKFQEAIELLHQARDKMLQGMDIAGSVGMVVLGSSELMERTVLGL